MDSISSLYGRDLISEERVLGRVHFHGGRKIKTPETLMSIHPATLAWFLPPIGATTTAQAHFLITTEFINMIIGNTGLNSLTVYPPEP